MVGIADLFGASAPQSQPVINAPTALNNLDAQTAMNQQRMAVTAGQTQDIANKQRSLQLSMLNGVMTLPEDKQAAALSNVVQMMNRMNGGLKFNENMTPATAKMLLMANVPTEQVPTFAMNQQMVPMMKAVQDRLSGNTGQPQSGGMSQGAPMPQGAVQPMPPNGVINGGGVPVPQGGGQPIDSQTLAMLATIPGMDKAASTINAIQNESPQGQANITAAKKTGENLAEAQKGALEANEGYQQVRQSIESLKQFAADPNLPQSKNFIPSSAQAKISQNLGGTMVGKALGYNDQSAANTYNTFSTINESQTINAIRSLADTGQIKMTRTLENIINRGYLIDPDVSPEAKQQQAQAIENELENSAIAAQNVASKMSGGQGNTPYKAPYIAHADASHGQQPQTGGRVQVITPDGRMGSIDAAHLQELLAAGGKVLK